MKHRWIVAVGAAAMMASAVNGQSARPFIGTNEVALRRATATGATTPRPLEDRFADRPTPKDFGAIGNEIANDTAALQAWLDFGCTNSGRVTLGDGRYRFTAPLVVRSGASKLLVEGSGKDSGVLVSGVVGQSAFVVGSATYITLRDLAIIGPGATSGHGIRLQDPTFENGSYTPQHFELDNVLIQGFRGSDVDHLGNAMAATGLFVVNALETHLRKVTFYTNTVGAYFYRSYTPRLNECVFVDNVKAGLVDHLNEGLSVDSSDFVGGSGTSNMVTLVSPAGVDGEQTLQAGNFVTVDSRHSVLTKSKLKNGWSQVVVKSLFQPTLADNTIMVDVENGIWAFSGVNAHGNTFYPFYVASGASTRKYIRMDMPVSMMSSVGSIRDNFFDCGGGGTFDAWIYINGQGASYPACGTISGNTFGSPDNRANTTIYRSGIKTVGAIGELVMSGNHVRATTGVTITNLWDMAPGSYGAGPQWIENDLTKAGGTVVTEWVPPQAGFSYRRVKSGVETVVAQSTVRTWQDLSGGTYRFAWTNAQPTETTFDVAFNYSDSSEAQPAGWYRVGTNWFPWGLRNVSDNVIPFGFGKSLGYTDNFSYSPGNQLTVGNVDLLLATHGKSLIGVQTNGSSQVGLVKINATNEVELSAGGLPVTAAGRLNATQGIRAPLPVYTNNAAAISGGLAVGDFYRTGSNPDQVCVVQ